MAFIADEEMLGLRIESMSLHVVGGEEFKAMPPQPVEHAEFFIERIRNTDVEPVFAFDPLSHTKNVLEEMARGQQSFEIGGQVLAREFARLHPTSSRDGALFIFELRTNDPTVRIYSLIKYDYQSAIEQRAQEGDNQLRLIIQAFVADKRAIQKAALIRVINGVAQLDVAARDRMRQSPDIGDYFASYLHVVRVRDNQQLNRKMIETVSNVLKELKDMLPGRDVPAAFRRVKELLSARPHINGEVIEETIIGIIGMQLEEDSVAKIQTNVRRKIRAAKLDGLEFSPDRELLRVPALRRIRTTEGVIVYYPDRITDTSVVRQPAEDGSETITITTRRIEEDGIVRKEPRSAA